MPIYPINYGHETPRFTPVTSFFTGMKFMQDRANAKAELEGAKLRNRLYDMTLKETESEKAFQNEIANSLLAPQNMKNVTVTGPEKLTPTPINQPGGTLMPGFGSPSGGINENTPAAPAMPGDKTQLPLMTEDQFDSPSVQDALTSPGISSYDAQDAQITPFLEEAKQYGITEQMVRSNPRAAMAFIEKKKAEGQAVFEKKIDLVKSLSAINPNMAANLWNSDPDLKAMGPFESQNAVESVKDESGDVIGHWVMNGGKREFVKDTEGSVSDFKTFYRGYKQDNPQAGDSEISRAWHDRKLNEARQRIAFSVTTRQDTQSSDDFKSWAKPEQDQAILEGLITGKGAMQFFSRGDRRNFGNFSHASNKYQIEHGLTPGVVALMRSDYKAGDMSLRNQKKIYDMSNSFVMNINSQIGKVKEIYSKLPRTQYKLLNIPIRELRVRAKGSGEEAAAASYLIEISNEIGKLSTGSAASIRELSESAQRQWAKIHDGTLPMKDMAIVLDTTQEQANMRLQSLEDAMDMTRQLIQGSGTARPVNPPNPTQPPKVDLGKFWKK
jgi:hypothetical protein